MRTINATLQAALDAGGFNVYIKARIRRTLGSYDQTFDVLKYRLTGTTLDIKTHGAIPISTPAAPTTIELIRGVTITGVNYTLSTSKFFSIKGSILSAEGGTLITSEVQAHLINPIYMDFLADGTYTAAISAYCTALGKTYTLKNSSATFWTDQFLPTGKNFTTNNAQSFLTLLRQKALIFACDNGAEDILFYCATDLPVSFDYEIAPESLYYLETGFNPRARFVARDEVGSIRYSGTAGDPLHNIGYRHTSDSMPTRYEQEQNIKPYPIAIQLYPQNGDYISFDDDQTHLYPALITELFDPSLSAIPWRTEMSQQAMFSTGEGGSDPSLEGRENRPITNLPPLPPGGRHFYGGALHTELFTGRFAGALSDADTSPQEAFETLDTHTHTTSTDLNVTETLQLSGDITPSSLTANQNNYNPTGWDSAVVMRLQTDGTNRTITGLAGGTDGRIAILINIDSANIISLQDESGSSTAANRFTLPTSATLLNIHPDASVVLQYDSTSSRWRVLSLMDHALLTGIGSNTHSQIDTHISSTHLAFNDGEGNPADPGSASADGTSAYAARRDHVHKGPTKAVIIFPTHALSDTVNASSTEYLCPFIDGNFGTERAMAVTRAGTIKNFYVRQVGTQPASGTLVCHVRQNTASDIISITIAAGSAGPATRSETATSVAVSAGDFIGFKFVNNATAVSATIGFVIVEIEFDP